MPDYRATFLRTDIDTLRPEQLHPGFSSNATDSETLEGHARYALRQVPFTRGEWRLVKIVPETDDAPAPLKAKGFVWQQAADLLRQKIRAGELEACRKIPSHIDLAEMLDCPVSVIQSALAHLRTQGYVFTRKGRGTFISHPDTWPKRSDQHEEKG